MEVSGLLDTSVIYIPSASLFKIAYKKISKDQGREEDHGKDGAIKSGKTPDSH